MGFFKEGLLILLFVAINVGGGLLDDSDSTSALPGKGEEIADPFQNSNDDEYELEKRDANPKGHSFMYLGKKSFDQRDLADLFQYLQRNYQQPSWKRGHSIMRFGKRGGGDKHNFIRFGKRSSAGDYDFNDSAYPEEEKRASHSMMYFGKRDPSEGPKKTGHSMMYFGKRQMYQDSDEDKRSGHSMMYFGKRDSDSYPNADELEKKAGHEMMYFGKRDEDDDFEKRAGHSMMYFGKRNSDDFEKRNGHSMMYFGKRSDDNPQRKSGHSMMYFGKRGNDETGTRAGHSMMYFGKRDSGAENDTEKRAGHSMMYFGKRDDDESGKRAGHSMMYFGKRYSAPVDEEDVEKKGGHSMMYFGKRLLSDDTLNNEEKRTGHSMMYFGKRNSFEDGEPLYEIDEESKPEYEKRAKHGMMYFGKKNEGSDLGGKRAHSMIHFGKRASGGEGDIEEMEKKASHSIIRFGKRQPYRIGQDPSSWLPASGPLGPINSRYINLFSLNPERRQAYDKKKHNMMHFGKRSVDELLNDGLTANDENHLIDRANATASKTDKSKSASVARNKRQTNEYDEAPTLPMNPYASQYISPDENYEDDFHIEDEGQPPKYLVMQPRSVEEPNKSKNIFLRFG